MNDRPPRDDPSEPAERRPCLFCSRAADPASLEPLRVYSDEFFLATHAIEDEGESYLGNLLVQTRRHATSLGGLSFAESTRIGAVLGALSRAIERVTGAAWTYCFGFTEGYRHVHLVLLARYPGTPPEYVRLRVTDWPGAPRAEAAQVGELVQRLRSELERDALPAAGD
ncbi:MAG: HIT family protein [Thermoplasmata archaeon]